jgi:hypothetical protein
MTAGADSTAEPASLDAFVDGFASQQPPRPFIHPVRVLLAVAATVCVLWLLVPTVDELAYQWSGQSTVIVNDATVDALARIPDNTPVTIPVVLGNKSAEISAWRPGSLRLGPIEVREAVGSPLYVEYGRRDFPALGPFVQTDVTGRLVSFNDDSELHDVVAYFRDRMRVAVAPHARAVIVGEVPGKMGVTTTAWLLGVALVVFSWASLWRDRFGAAGGSRVLQRRRERLQGERDQRK